MQTGGCGVRAGAILVREQQSLLMSPGNSPLDSLAPCKGGQRASQEGWEAAKRQSFPGASGRFQVRARRTGNRGTANTVWKESSPLAGLQNMGQEEVRGDMGGVV